MKRFNPIISRQLLGDQCGPGRYMPVWQDECQACQERSGWYRSGNAGIYGRLVSPDGTLDGSSYPIASASQAARPPAPESESHPWCCGFSRPAPTHQNPTHAIAPSEETLPRLSADGGWSPVVWQRANTGGTGDDLYGRMLWAGGRPADGEPAFALVDAAGDQESPAIAGPNPRHRTLSMCSKCEIAVSWQTNHGVTA